MSQKSEHGAAEHKGSARATLPPGHPLNKGPRERYRLSPSAGRGLGGKDGTSDHALPSGKHNRHGRLWRATVFLSPQSGFTITTARTTHYMGGGILPSALLMCVLDFAIGIYLT